MADDVTASDGNGWSDVSEAKARMRSAALALFAEHGYRATSVRDVMRACNLTPGALYAHYPSKESLLADLIREGHVRLEGILARVSEEPADGPPELLARLIYFHVTYTLQNAALARVANDEFDSLPDDMRTEIVQMRARMNQYFEDALDEGVAAGLFDGRNRTLTLLAVLTSANQLTAWYRTDGAISLDEVARWHAVMTLRLVMFPSDRVEAIDSTVDNAVSTVSTLDLAAV